MRHGLVLIVYGVFLVGAAQAASVSPGTGIGAVRPEITFDALPMTLPDRLALLTGHYLNTGAPARGPTIANVILQVVLLGFGVVAGLKTLTTLDAYPAALASAARSRTRWTIARNPFDRWADRWSFRPSRPNSAPASTSSTSETVRSL